MNASKADIEIKENARARGSFVLRVYKNGKLIENYADHNMVVNAGKKALATLLAAADSNKKIAFIAVGTNGDGPALTDTAITGAYTKAISGYSYPETGQVKFSWTIETGQANGIAIREFGLLCADKTLFARKTRGVIEKEDDISLEGEWTIIF